jgi:hypothetical protein
MCDEKDSNVTFLLVLLKIIEGHGTWDIGHRTCVKTYKESYTM